LNERLSSTAANQMVPAEAAVQRRPRIIEHGCNTEEPEPTVEQVQVTKTELSASFEELVDIVDTADGLRFLVKGKAGFEALAEWSTPDAILVPPKQANIPWALPYLDNVKKHIDQDTDGQLFDDLVAYHKSVSELPDERLYDLLATWVMHTYLLEKFVYSPIICLFAVAERGKTRTGKSLVYVARRGLHVESLNPAYIYRTAACCTPTFFFDVMDIWRKATAKGAEDTLLMRFERGAKVPRVTAPNKGPFEDISFFKVFGPTIIGTNEPASELLETRSIVINMRESSRRFDNQITPDTAADLRDRLTAFRARHMADTLPCVEKPARGRLGDITQPLFQIARLVKPQVLPVLETLICDIEQKRRQGKSICLDGRILSAISSLRGSIKNGHLPVKTITDTLNSGISSFEQVTYQKVGRRLDALGFEKDTLSGNVSAIAWNEENLNRLMESYGHYEGRDTGAAAEGSTFAPNQPEASAVTERTISVQFCDDAPCTCTRQSFVTAVADYAGRYDPHFHPDAPWLGKVEEAAGELWAGTPEAYGRAEAFFTRMYISLTRPDWLANTGS
jgi:hypothetical protein